MPALLVAVVLLVLTAGMTAALLGFASRVSFLLAAYVTASAVVVVLTELLSFGRAVTTWGYLVAELIVFAAAATAWTLRGRPRAPHLRHGIPALRSHPVLAALLVAVALAVAYEAFLVVAVPPNTGDAMSAHLSRVAAWLQHHGIYWIPDAHTPRQNEWPPVAQIQILYTTVFLHRDTFAAAPQFVGGLAAALAVAGLARRVGYARPAATYAALLALTIPVVALESTTTQNDLVVAAYVATAAYFFAGGGRKEVVIGALALALALGTKVTAFLALPAIVLVALVSLPRRRIAFAAVAALAAFAVVGVYGYARNAVHTGGFFGSQTAQSGYRPAEVTLGGTAASAAKLAYRFVDFSGYHLKPGMREPVADVARTAFDVLHIDPEAAESSAYPFNFDPNISAEEDTSWYGPLGFLLVVPAAALALFGRPRAPGVHAARRRVLALAPLLFAAGLIVVYREGSWYGRYLLTGVMLALPLVAGVYARRRLAVAYAAIAVVTLTLVHVYNAHKPSGLDGRTPIWRLSRIDAQTVPIPGFDRVLRTVERLVHEDGSVGVMFGEEDWDYPLYGRRFTRRVVQLPTPGALRVAEARGLRVVVSGRYGAPRPIPPGWRVYDFRPLAMVFVRRTPQT